MKTSTIRHSGLAYCLCETVNKRDFHSSNNKYRYSFCHSYCNSILQALYYCKPFRECVLTYQSEIGLMVSHYPLSPTTPGFNTNGSNGPSSYFAPQHSPSGAPNPASIVSPTTALSPAVVGKNHQRDTSNSGASGATGPSSATQRNIVGNLLPNGGGPDPNSAPQESMFLCLQDLFQRIQTHSKKTQYFTPTAFVAKVKKENGMVGRGRNTAFYKSTYA